MIPIVLTPPSTLNVVDHHRPLSEEDCSLALPPLGVFIPPAAPSFSPNSACASITSISSTDDDDDDNGVLLPYYSPDAPACRVRQWTGMPIRAIAPLPRRTPCVLTPTDTTPTPTPPRARVAGTPTVAPTAFQQRLAAARAQWASPDADADADSGVAADSDSDSDSDDEELVDRVRIKDRRRHATPAAPRCCAYESITATEGLAAWSFEELRVECYAQSRIARGTNPPPVDRPYLAIPPAFVPRIVSRS